MSAPSSPSAARIWTGLGIVYPFWGTTYLAIVSAAGAARDRISGEDRRAKVEPELGFEG
jgi:hypothetical protein